MAFTYRTIKGSELTWAELDENFRLVDQYHDESKNAAVTALSSANFKGNWSALTGALAVPASVYHSGSYWMLLSNLANVTTATPGVSASWQLLPAGNVKGPISSVDGNGVVFDGTTGKLIKSLGAAPVKKTGDTMTGPLAQAAGTEALPSYTFSGDLDTGIYSPSANILALSTAGQTRLLVSSAGSVQVLQRLSVGSAVPGLSDTFLVTQGADFSIGTDYAIRILGAGYDGAISLNATSMQIGQNSSARSLTFHSGSSFAERLRISGSSGDVTVTGGGVLGYGAGSGGTVTQATSKSTAVTLNKPSGQITMNNAALASGASVTFALNNTAITSTDIVIVGVGNTAGSTSYSAFVTYTSNGICYITVTNRTAGSLSDALLVNFAIIKGATS